MTTESPHTMRHPLHDTIEKHSIAKVAVVDDAFDKVTKATFEEGELGEFVSALNEDDSLLRTFHRLVFDESSEAVLTADDMTDDAIGKLWQNRNLPAFATDEPEFAEVLESTLFRVHGPKFDEVDELCRFLREELKIRNIRRFGTADSRPGTGFDVVFIDYRFGTSRERDAAVRRAVDWAAHFYATGQALILLMSAEAEGRERADAFRSESGLTRGLFEFIGKSEIGDSGKLHNRLESICKGWNTRHVIHRFAVAAEKAITKASDTLTDALRGLGLEDYAYLEQISLREDGHPLGDYMLWLLGEYFGHQLATEGSLKTERAAVNSLRHEQLLPLQRPPSVMLAKMYGAAITEPVYEGWNAHPRFAARVTSTTAGRGAAAATEDTTRPREEEAIGGVAEGGGQGTDPQIKSQSLSDATSSEGGDEPEKAAGTVSSAEEVPLYQLGDLIVADATKPAYLVLNAGCDLQFSPGDRDCDIDQSILLVPGEFQSLRGKETEEREKGPDRQAKKRTELFEIGNERYRIVWKHRRVESVPHRDVRDRFATQGYKRESRLKLAYALEIQQHFASQLTRVGVPTPTPVFRERPAEVYGKATDGRPVRLEPIENGVIVFHHRGRDQFVLTVDCVHELLSRIDGFAAEIEQELAESATGADASEEDLKAAAKQRGKRGKYLAKLIAAREALAHSCAFQHTLHDVTAAEKGIRDKDVPGSPGLKRLEIRCTDAILEECGDHSPVTVAFSLPDAAVPEHDFDAEAKVLAENAGELSG